MWCVAERKTRSSLYNQNGAATRRHAGRQRALRRSTGKPRLQRGQNRQLPVKHPSYTQRHFVVLVNRIYLANLFFASIELFLFLTGALSSRDCSLLSRGTVRKMHYEQEGVAKYVKKIFFNPSDTRLAISKPIGGMWNPLAHIALGGAAGRGRRCPSSPG